jgi:hypothetical protein
MRLIAFTIVILSGALVAASAGFMKTLDAASGQQVLGVLVMLAGAVLTAAELFVTGFFTEVKNAFNHRGTTAPVERHPQA